MKASTDQIALFDLDGTLADYEKTLVADLALLASPDEPTFDIFDKDAPAWFNNRIKLIRKSPGWWRNLDKFQLGFEVLEMARNIGFQVQVLTKGPESTPPAWMEKFEWCRANLPKDILVTVTQDKSVVYGRVLVDDYPEYVGAWLANRPRGLAIMPAGSCNTIWKHPQAIRYTGNNREEVQEALSGAFYRAPGQVLLSQQ